MERAGQERPYSIELVPADKGWILEKMAREIKQEADRHSERFSVSITHTATDSVDLTFFLPESAFRPLKHSIAATYLAHKEDHPGAARLFQDVARSSDFCVTSSRRYKAVLESDGARRVFQVPLGTDTGNFVPKLKLGVVGRTYDTGRKGEQLLGPSMSLPFVEFVFTGGGWPSPAAYYDDASLARFYQDIDYLVVPSLIEGGPAPLLEALSCGCPVIAPSDVGMVEDFPHIPYERGNAEDLKRVIEKLLGTKLSLRQAVLGNDWATFARRHLEIFAQEIERALAAGRLPLRTKPDAPTTGALRIALVTHGTEDSALGGPTVRIRAMHEWLQRIGYSTLMLHNLNADAIDNVDIVHIFNIWPLQTALKTILAAKRAGKRVVFSPIALDLAYLPVFMQLTAWLISNHRLDDIGEWLKTLVAATPPRRFDGSGAVELLEGVPGHFEMLRECIALADHVVFLSEHERGFLASIGAQPGSFSIVHNASDDIHAQQPDRDAFRRKYKLDRYVLSVGRLEYRKNQALLALALRGLDIKLVLIGGVGDADYIPLLDRCAGENVLRIGRVEDRNLLASAYAGAEAFVFPTWAEGAPLVAIEAGLVGTPLVVSSMSSEGEYFGEFATYVHPADIQGIRAAITRLIETPESDERRAARSAYFKERYSFERHAASTLSVYRDVAARPARVIGSALAMEISALIHFLSTGQPLTGVPTVELNVLRQVLDARPDTMLFAHLGRERGFRRIDPADITDFSVDRYISKYHATDASSLARAFVVEANGLSSVSTERSEWVAMPGPTPLRARTVRAAKRVIRGLPRLPQSVAVSALRSVLPRFDPYAATPAHRGFIESRALASVLPQLHTTQVAPTAGGASPPPLATVLRVEAAPARAMMLPTGARVLTLGQGWLSNQDLLDHLVESVEQRGVQLEPYVFDLSYHTAAHLSGWSDNDIRFARLLRLLRNSRCVYTEAHQVEQELEKVKAAYGLSYSIRTTGLSIREMPAASRRGLPSLRRGDFVVYISSFNRRKNHDFLVNVWRELHKTFLAPTERTTRLLLVGEVQEEHKYGDPAFQQQLSSWGIDVLRHVPDEGISWLYENCLFTVYPSTKEGWGVPVVESLAKGRICIASRELPACQEITCAAIVKLSPHDHYAWYEALKTWIGNSQMREAFEAEARRYTAPTWRDVAQVFLTRTSAIPNRR